MKIIETPLNGAYIIELEKIFDNRGYFLRTYCKEEFEKKDLNTNWVQCNVSFNNKKGTLRGLHYQSDPYPETKLIRCIRGKVLDVIVDLRKESETYCKTFSIELSNENNLSLYIPNGFAHGFQTLEDNSELFYQMSEFFHSNLSNGIRWNDPILNIKWPLEITEISEKDKQLPYLII